MEFIKYKSDFHLDTIPMGQRLTGCKTGCSAQIKNLSQSFTIRIWKMRVCMLLLDHNIHSPSKETQLFWADFYRWPLVTDPDLGSCERHYKVHLSTLFPKRNATFHVAFLLKKSVVSPAMFWTNNKRVRDVRILGTTASLTAGQPLLLQMEILVAIKISVSLRANIDCYHTACTLTTDQLFNLEFQFESVFNLEFQPKFGI